MIDAIAYKAKAKENFIKAIERECNDRNIDIEFTYSETMRRFIDAVFEAEIIRIEAMRAVLAP